MVLRMFWCLNIDLNCFWQLASLIQKMVSTSSLRNLQKLQKGSFQMLRTFVFELKVASRTSSKKLPMSKLEFKHSWMLCRTFRESCFNFDTEKLAKIWKILISTAHNIGSLTQACFKTVFWECPYAQILIYIDFNTLSQFPKKWFQLRHWKRVKKLINTTDKYYFLTFRTLVF